MWTIASDMRMSSLWEGPWMLTSPIWGKFWMSLAWVGRIWRCRLRLWMRSSSCWRETMRRYNRWHTFPILTCLIEKFSVGLCLFCLLFLFCKNSYFISLKWTEHSQLVFRSIVCYYILKQHIACKQQWYNISMTGFLFRALPMRLAIQIFHPQIDSCFTQSCYISPTFPLNCIQ